jgi:hypothetical protein
MPLTFTLDLEDHPLAGSPRRCEPPTDRTLAGGPPVVTR